MLKQIKKRIATVAAAVLILANPFVGSGVALAKDSDHSGAAFLQTELSPSEHRIQGSINYQPTGDAWFGQDTKKSPEWVAEKAAWSPESWKFTQALLNGNGSVQAAAGQIPWLQKVGTGKYFSPTTTAKEFKTLTDKYEDVGDGSRNTLVMTFPGWAAADRVYNVSNGGKGIDRNADDTSDEFARIDSASASAAAGKVNDNLVSELNRALDDSYGVLVSENGKKNPDLSMEGFMNLLFLTVNGKFPDKGAQWKYNEVDYSIDASQSVDGKPEVIKNVWNRKSASDKLVTLTPNRDGAVKSDAYTYAVPKGYHAGVGQSGNKKYASDLYAITWFDVATAATSATVRGENNTKKDANNTVVGEQVDNWLYSTLSGILSVLGIRNADDLVFGEWGNLFKNNTYEIYLVVQLPFIVLGSMLLLLAVYDALRKSAKDYLSVGDVRTIESVFGRCINAILMIAILDVLVLVAISANQVLVQFAAQLSHFMNNALTPVKNGQGGNFGGLQSFFENIFGFFSITSIAVSIIMAGVNIKFTWRYVARAISFGIYFVTAPVIFCLDALRGSGKLFEFGPGTADTMKNLIGLVFQQGMDALGIAFAINVGRMIFGNGALITILGFLSVEAITNALMQSFGVRAGSIRGIAEAGTGLFNKVKGAGLAAGGALAGSMAAKGFAALKNGRNKDDEEILRNKIAQSAKKNGSSDGTSKSDITDGFNKEAQTKAMNDRKEGAQSSSVTETLNAEAVSEPVGGIRGKLSDGWNAVTGTVAGAAGAVKDKASDITSGLAEAGRTLGQKTGVTALGSKVAAGGQKIGRGLGRVPGVNAFLEGGTSRGVYGDKDTASTARAGFRGNLSSGLNPDNYRVDENGRVKAKGFKGRASRMGRDLARFAGGATLGMVTDPKFASRALIGAAAQGLSTLTHSRFDDAVAGVMNMQNYESALTGGTSRSTMEALAGTIPGRMLGMRGAAFNTDAISMDRFAPELSAGTYAADAQGRGVGGNPYDQYSSEVTDGATTSMTMRTAIREDSASRADQAAQAAFQELHSMEDNPRERTTYSREDLVKMTGDAVRGQSAQKMLDYMDKNGYEAASTTDGGQVYFDRTYTRSATDGAVDLQDPKAYKIGKQLETSPQLHDTVADMVYKQGTQDGQVYAFTPQTPTNGAYARGLKQRELDLRSIENNKTLSPDQKMSLTRDVYAVKPASYETGRSKLDLTGSNYKASNPVPKQSGRPLEL